MTSIYEFGSVATYTCANGFYLEGEAQRTCTFTDRISAFGVFDGKAPTCICKDPNIIVIQVHILYFKYSEY